MVKIYVDGAEIDAREGDNLLQAVLSNKGDLPYFCWHPSLGSVGACRQCAVIQYQDAEDERGRLVMACMTPVSEGLRVSVAATEADEFRASVIEWLMENHPHDCPVCEEGGECHLQDMTVMTGHTNRRYRGKKRTFENQNLGPFINHEMNRCITCYRCVRFYKDYAGGNDLQAFGSRSRMYFGREKDGVLESPFSGNLVEVCPTGVFTDKPFSQDYTRKWDLQSAPSVCAHCSLGCNTLVGGRYDRIKRIHNRYNSDLNGYFLCDKGRYGFGFVNSESRLLKAGKSLKDGEFEEIDSDSAEKLLADTLGASGAIGIGSPRASLEANFALRELVGTENFCSGLSSEEERLVRLIIDIKEQGNAISPSLSDVEEADAVLILGEDVINTAARLALSVRQSARNKSFEKAEEAGIPLFQEAGVIGHAQGARSPLFIAHPTSTDLDEIAESTFHDHPENIAALGYEIAHGLHESYMSADENLGTNPFVLEVVAALRGAKNPLIISGTSLRNADLIKASANIAWALKEQGNEANLLFVGSEANTFGAAMLGSNLNLDAALNKARAGAPIVLLENDLYHRTDFQLVEQALSSAYVILLDSMETQTAERADAVIPTAPFTESIGTYVNFEGRAQRYYNAHKPNEPVLSAWEWLSRVSQSVQFESSWTNHEELLHLMATLEGFAKINEVSPGVEYRNIVGNKVPRATHRYSGRTAMNASVNIHEPKTAIDEYSPFSYSMEGAIGDQPASLTSYVWSPGWNSNQSVFKFQDEVAGPINGDKQGVVLISQKSNETELHEKFREPCLAPGRSPKGQYRVVPAYRLFGSEELSAQSAAIQERSQRAFITISPTDAEELGVQNGEGVHCGVLDSSFEVIVDKALVSGLVAIGMGMATIGAELSLEFVSLVKDPDYHGSSEHGSSQQSVVEDE